MARFIDTHHIVRLKFGSFRVTHAINATEEMALSAAVSAGCSGSVGQTDKYTTIRGGKETLDALVTVERD